MPLTLADLGAGSAFVSTFRCKIALEARFTCCQQIQLESSGVAAAGAAGGNRSLVALAASRLAHQSLLCFIDSACGLVGCAVEMIRGWDGSHGREHIGGDLLIFEELLMARVTISHVNL